MVIFPRGFTAMDPSSIDGGFPAIEPSFRFHPHAPFSTYSAPTPPIATLAVDPYPGTPISATTIIDYPGSKITDAPFAWMTSLMPQHSQFHHPTPTPARPPQSIDTFSSNLGNPEVNFPAQTAQSTPQSNGSITKGAKIGVIIGITVVVILSLLAFGMGILDCRRRFKRRRERKQNCDSELIMWESEMRNGRKGQTRVSKPGLWDGLRVGQGNNNTLGATSNGAVERYRKGSQGRLWERIGEMRSEDAAGGRKERATVDSYEREPEWLPAYMPRERTSAVSVGSLGLPVMGKPVAVRSFLGERK